MSKLDWTSMVRETCDRIAYGGDFAVDRIAKLRMHACSILIESTFSTWISMWEANSLTVSDLRMFFDRNFKDCLTNWVNLSFQLSHEIGSENSGRIAQLLSLVLRFEKEHASDLIFNHSVFSALLGSMVARQAFNRGVLEINCLDKVFCPYSPSIHPDFFQQCLNRTDFQLQPNLSLLELSTSLLTDQ